MSTPNPHAPKTVQTGQDGERTNAPFFEITESGQQWHWCLWSGNGRMLCTNAVGYDRKKDALQAIKVLAANVGKATVVVRSHPR